MMAVHLRVWRAVHTLRLIHLGNIVCVCVCVCVTPHPVLCHH